MPKPFTRPALYSRAGQPLRSTRAMYAQPRRLVQLDDERAVDVMRYAKGDGGIGAFLKGLGPAGRVVSAIGDLITGSKKRKPTRTEAAAKRLLESFGIEVIPPEGQRRETDTQRSIEAAAELLKQLGFTVEKGEPLPAVEEAPAPPPKPSNTVEVNVGGRKYRVPRSHPLATGERIKTPQSSNVFEFFYDADKMALYIRFDAPKTESKPSKRPGSVYKYSNVPAALFLDMLKANSKGSFVWDRIRIRGTVSGHSYDYSLVSITEGHVPRKASFMGDGEYYVERTVRGKDKRGNVQVLKSKPTAPAGVPNRGRPNRAGPNRGRPNRGR